jgi:AraC family transcriptional regulator of adaptative response / DNA-3-methyladenine glycosylase II
MSENGWQSTRAGGMLSNMTLDPEICYRAVASRDPRFDGRFFTGVVSTGIYCRPICPARTPRRENVRFFACAAAAEEAGFRPCMRCRPETAPGTPAWAGSSASVARGLRLIEEGFLDDHSVDELASVLGVGARHLRRLFRGQLGASPVRLAMSRRVHFARRLIDDTDLPLTEVAFASGFASLRRFNDAFRRVFASAPSSVRRSRRSERAATLRLELYRRPPYDAGAVFAFLDARAVEGMERVANGYRRVVRAGGTSGVIDVAPRDERGVTLSVSASLTASLPEVVGRTRRVFDLDADPLRISSHLGRDPALAPLVEAAPGLPVPGAWDCFEMTIRAIVGQQVSVAAARTTLSTIVAAYGDPVEVGGETWVSFPTAARLARARLERLGVIRSRARAIRAVSRMVVEGKLDIGRLIPLERVVRTLGEIEGIGPWTAQMVAMRALGDPDAFPAADLGLRRAARDIVGSTSPGALVEHAKRWRPWRAYAAAHLWHISSREVMQ